jgi:hypothetical protein
MKKILLLCLLFCFSILQSQEKLASKNGKIIFEASVPTFEEVSAENNEVSCILNLKTSEISSLAFLKSFRFKLPLMEQHFNENYIESNHYPKSVFKGKIENFDVTKLTETPTSFIINGKMELHGKSKKISVTANINKINEVVTIRCYFTLNADDFDIKIPSMVKSKVSNVINVTTDFALK